MATSPRGHGIAGIFSSVDTANMQGSLGQESHWHVLVLCMAKWRWVAALQTNSVCRQAWSPSNQKSRPVQPVKKRPCPTKGSIEFQLKTNTDWWLHVLQMSKAWQWFTPRETFQSRCYHGSYIEDTLWTSGTRSQPSPFGASGAMPG